MSIKVVKRDGRIVNFDQEKIKNVIMKAMSETKEGVDIQLADEISADIATKLNSNVSVEEIQDMVENKLMESNRKDVAKTYIIYRYERNKKRNIKDRRFNLLDDEFISKYKHLPNPMDQLGSFVYYRTYSRWMEKENRRENWWETVRRAVEYNCGLANTSRQEAQELYDNIFNLKQYLSGRTFWVGGTKVAVDFPTGNFNCTFNIIDSFNAFKDIFYLCLVGAGVGFRILKSDVENLPKVRTNLKLFHDDYYPKAKNERKDNTSLTYQDNETVTLEIGDSKAGWVQGLEYYFKIITDSDYKNIKNLIINYDMVRPKGEPLKTFGGTASGHSSIKNMFVKINKIIQGYSTLTERIKLQPIDCLDIATIIGENVVVGGVRRTALIGLIDWDDKEAVEAKDNLYILKDGEWVSNPLLLHRSMSNNSIFYEHKPTREQLHWQLEKMRYSGEPGWVNAEAARKRRKNMNGVNPCFRGDMKLLTVNGYKTFEEICDKEIEIINKNGDNSLSKVWCSGKKEIYEIKINKNRSIFCTKDHIFMDINGNEVKAIDLKGKELMPDLINKNYDFTAIVTDVVSTGKIEKVYDFTEPLTHWGIVEGVIAHNCGEILLDNHGLCNLVTVNVMGFVKDHVLDLNALLRAQRLSARASFRMTQIELELYEWNKVQKRDHIVGCSLTGWQDLVNALDYTVDDQRELLSLLKKEARDAINSYCDELGIQDYPDAVTTVKPEGTLSQLSGVSSGIHYSHSPYFIRRVRINAHDPLVKVAEELNWTINCEVGQNASTCNTKVIDFYCKAPEGRTKYDVSAIEQLENYRLFMEEYVEHNASITVHVRENEWDDVEEWVWNNWDKQVALSFLSLDDSFYQLMPYESITKEEYEENINKMKPFIPSLLQKYESHEEHQVDSSDCSSGICPIR